MTLIELTQTLTARPWFLKKGPGLVARKFKVSLQDATAALKIVRAKQREVNRKVVTVETLSNDSDNVITEFEQYLDKNGIDHSMVNSVKYWQNMKGEQRFSVVTKNDRTAEEIQKDIEEFAASYSPKARVITKGRGVDYKVKSTEIKVSFCFPTCYQTFQHFTACFCPAHKLITYCRIVWISIYLFK